MQEVLNRLKNSLAQEAQARKKEAREQEQAQAHKQTHKQAQENTPWHASLGDIKPIKKADRAPSVNKKDPSAHYKRASAEHDTRAPSIAISPTKALLEPVATHAMLAYKHPTLQKRVFEALKNGDIWWQMGLDLHGQSIDGAYDLVLELIQSAQLENITCVKIVHGHGDGVLKTCINGWLKQLDDVMAFVSAPPKDGGTGAVLVLLKRARIR